MNAVLACLTTLARGEEYTEPAGGIGRAGRPEARSRALVQLGALLASDAAPISIMRATQDATARGISAEEIVGLLACLVPILGSARVATVAPKVATALGYDLADDRGAAGAR